MYQVLIVDDEPIILSGIKFMIDWQKENMGLIGTARNGQQALEMIDERRPDIVICDINMPVMTGLELLKTLHTRPNAPSFIMLTNLEQFEMAQQSLRYKAVEYLLKTELEPGVLHAALQRAAEDCDRRSTLASAGTLQEALVEHKARIVANSLQKLLEGASPQDVRRQKEILQKNEVLNCFGLQEVLLDYSPIPGRADYTREDLRRVFESQHELLETLLPKAFKNSLLFYPNSKQNGFVLFCWNVDPQMYEHNTAQLFSKFCVSSAALTQTRIGFLATEVHAGAGGVDSALQQLSELRESYYLGREDYLFYHAGACPRLQPLKPTDLCNKLVYALRAKDRSACRQMLEKAAAQLGAVPHSRASGAAFCAELYSTISAVLLPLLEQGRVGKVFQNPSETLHQLNSFTSRRQLLQWLLELSAQLDNQLAQLTETRSDLVDKVKRYVEQNVEKHIMLQDVADHVNMAPSYLSAVFKKQCGKNLVDFINEIKMDRACELIRDGSHKIYEVSYLLGFENAYYFTKVFKRHIGLTPKEYQYKLQRGENGEA